MTIQGTTAKTAPAPPAIPGLEQGNPAVSNRQGAAAGGQAGQAGQPVINTGPGRAETPREIRDRIRTEIQNAARDGREPQINVNPDFTNVVPQGAVTISVALFMAIAATIIFAPLARAFARRVDRQSEAALRGAADISPRIAQLQDSVDTMAMELERISEAQRFQSKLLAERVKDPA